MFKKISFILIVLFGCQVTAAPQPMRQIIMLLDVSQSEGRARPNYSQDASPALGAITFTLLPALYQKATPLLVSTSLLKNVLSHREIFFDFVKRDMPSLQQKYGSCRTFSHCASLRMLKNNCVYTDKMYHLTNSTCEKALTNTPSDAIDAAIWSLTQDKRFSEERAPSPLRLYSSRKELPAVLHREMSAYTLCAYAPLNTDEWIIKEVSTDLTLLIPKKYLKSISAESVLYNPPLEGQLTQLEKNLGLRINHLRDIIDIKQLMKDRPIAQDIVFTRHLSTLFTPKNSTATPHRWAIYVAGHGLPQYAQRGAIKQLTAQKKYYERRLSRPSYSRSSPHFPTNQGAQKNSVQDRLAAVTQKLSQTQYALKSLPQKGYESIICSLPLEEFKTFLTFLDTQIATTLLFYTSCYSGGTHLIEPYRTHGKDRTLSYDLVTGTASDNVALQDVPMLMLPPYNTQLIGNKLTVVRIPSTMFDLKNRSLAVYTTLGFDTFFAELQKTGERDYHHLVSLLHPYTDEEGLLKRDCISNIAHIRKAGKTTFEPVSAKPPFAIIDKTQMKPLTLKNTDAVLLYEQKLPEITLGKNKNTPPPAFLSMIPGPTWHMIPVLKAPDYTFIDLFLSFLQPGDLETPKVFWIKKLICDSADLPVKISGKAVLTNVVIVRNVHTYENIKYRTTTGAYFTTSKGVCHYLPFNNRGTIQARRVSFKSVAQELSVLMPGISINTESTQLP